MTLDIIHGDCLEVLPTMAAGSVDCVVTDPPYGINFMGKAWDKALPDPAAWRECLRVLKPGAFAAVMSAARSDCTWRLMRDLEEAGFDVGFSFVGWVYASGFPKGLDCGKAFDAEAGAEREVVGERVVTSGGKTFHGQPYKLHEVLPNTAPATDLARQWDGWKGGRQALKPALEPIIICQKPGAKRIIDNLREHGVGAFNCRGAAVPFEDAEDLDGARCTQGASTKVQLVTNNAAGREFVPGNGRHPANLLVSDHALNGRSKFFDLDAWADEHLPAVMDVAKPSRAEKSEDNPHPTCKPVALMGWLAKLLCPPGGTVLDPFLGSGTTLVAAAKLGLNGIGIEREAEYVEIARKRVAQAQEQLQLSGVG